MDNVGLVGLLVDWGYGELSGNAHMGIAVEDWDFDGH